MSASLGLFRLQQIDRQMDRVLLKIENIRKILEDDAGLRAAMERLQATQLKHDEARQVLNSAETDAASQNVKIAQAESSLYGGQVHNPKELQDLQNDVASLKRYLNTLEDRELETMVVVEDTENDLEAAKSALEQLKSRLTEEHKSLIASRDDLTRELQVLEVERGAASNAIAADHRGKYEQLRKVKNGLAVAEVLDGSCSACGSTLTPSVQQSARSLALLVHCPTCNRILYAS